LTIRNSLGFSDYRYRLVDSSQSLPRSRRQQLAKKDRQRWRIADPSATEQSRRLQDGSARRGHLWAQANFKRNGALVAIVGFDQVGSRKIVGAGLRANQRHDGIALCYSIADDRPSRSAVAPKIRTFTP
jgi:hypothetical protein